MSGKETNVVEVQEKLKDITECPICTEIYKEPKILPCIHTFCMLCLQESGVKTNKSPGDTMPCPVCRTEFMVPKEGFAGIQKNFFMERLIEMKNILAPSPTGILCDACQEDTDSVAEDETPPADIYCADCNEKFCSECSRNHRKFKATKSHRLVSLESMQCNIHSNVKPYTCDRHENRPLEIYCFSCQEVICVLCFYKSHSMHETSPLVDVVTDFRRIIQENADSTMSYALSIKQKLTGKDKDKAVFAQKVTELENEIKRIRQSLKECIDKDCDSLLQELRSIKGERTKEHDSQLYDHETILASMESFQAYSMQVTTIGSDVDICRAVNSLKARADELQQRYESLTLEPFPDIWLRKTEFHDSLYQSGSNIIGKIQENGDKTVDHKESLIRTVSSFVDELEAILDTTCYVEMADAAVGTTSTEGIEDFPLRDFTDHSHECIVDKGDKMKHKGEEEQSKGDEKMEDGKFVKLKDFAAAVYDKMEEWTTFEKQLNDKLKVIKAKMNLQRAYVSRLEKEKALLNEQADLSRFSGMQSSEIIDLKKQVALLTSIAYDGDKTTQEKKGLLSKRRVTFRQTIKTLGACNNAAYRVTGLTIINNELFISSDCNTMEVIDMRTLKFKRWWRAEQATYIKDIKPCVSKNCLYILSSNTPGLISYGIHILRCDDKGKVFKKWEVNDKNGKTAQISATDDSNVLLTIGTQMANQLIEYDPNGELIRTICLTWESGILNLMHSIKLTSDHFVVCHGNGRDSLERVCIIDINGNVLSYFGEVENRKLLNYPCYLEKDADSNILVADHLNRRLLLFSSSLKLLQEFDTQKLKYPLNEGEIECMPQKMIWDEANGRLFVAENILNNKKKQVGDELSMYTFSSE